MVDYTVEPKDKALVVLTDASGLEEDPELVEGVEGYISVANLPGGELFVFFCPIGIEKLFLVRSDRFTLASEVV